MPACLCNPLPRVPGPWLGILFAEAAKLAICRYDIWQALRRIEAGHLDDILAGRPGELGPTYASKLKYSESFGICTDML